MNILLNRFNAMTFMANKKINSKEIRKAEWIESAGDGSFASSTVSGANTRVYHALMINSKNPPVERNVVLQRVDDEVEIGDKNLKLSDSNFKESKTPEDELATIDDFTVMPTPTWEYDLGENKKLKKQLVMPQNTGKSEVFLGYTYEADEDSKPIKLKLRPLLNHRSMHGGHNELHNWNYTSAKTGAVVSGTKQGNQTERTYLVWSKQGEIKDKGHFYGNYHYSREADRGLQKEESGLYQPFELEVTLKPNETFTFASGTSPIIREIDIDNEVDKKASRLEGLYKQSGLPRNESSEMLQRAGDQFVVHRNSINGKTILAGYPWFNDWGRDTMIALPGLTLTTKRFNDAETILDTFAKFSKNGMLPNNFPENAHDTPGYNTIDASMWWFNALDNYKTEAGNKANNKFVKSQYKALEKVVTHHIYGRESGKSLISKNPKLENILDKHQPKLLVGEGNSGIGMDSDGLITADDGQLTWMDSAKWDSRAKKSHPYTPRDGKAVEINALWYNGLRVMANLADEFGEKDKKEQYNGLADVVKESMQKFKSHKGGLYDMIETPYNPEYNNAKRGEQIRSNQIIAAALPHCAFDKETQKDIVNTVQEHLLTPYGLRTLSPEDEDYTAYYPNANADARDSVYHQGPVWGWQLGSFCDAYLNVNDNTKQAKKDVKGFIDPLIEDMKGNKPSHFESGGCIGGMAELFDATGEYHPKGTPHQAWTVSEVLRTYGKIQDVIDPKS